eukprot:645997-Prorocentrum_minimum.AAC.6
MFIIDDPKVQGDRSQVSSEILDRWIIDNNRYSSGAVSYNCCTVVYDSDLPHYLYLYTFICSACHFPFADRSFASAGEPA